MTKVVVSLEDYLNTFDRALSGRVIEGRGLSDWEAYFEAITTSKPASAFGNKRCQVYKWRKDLRPKSGAKPKCVNSVFRIEDELGVRLYDDQFQDQPLMSDDPRFGSFMDLFCYALYNGGVGKDYHFYLSMKEGAAQLFDAFSRDFGPNYRINHRDFVIFDGNLVLGRFLVAAGLPQVKYSNSDFCMPNWVEPKRALRVMLKGHVEINFNERFKDLKFSPSLYLDQFRELIRKAGLPKPSNRDSTIRYNRAIDIYEFIKELDLQNEEEFAGLYQRVINTLRKQITSILVTADWLRLEEQGLPWLDREQRIIDKYGRSAEGRMIKSNLWKGRNEFVERGYVLPSDLDLEIPYSEELRTINL